MQDELYTHTHTTSLEEHNNQRKHDKPYSYYTEPSLPPCRRGGPFATSLPARHDPLLLPCLQHMSNRGLTSNTPPIQQPVSGGLAVPCLHSNNTPTARLASIAREKPRAVLQEEWRAPAVRRRASAAAAAEAVSRGVTGQDPVGSIAPKHGRLPLRLRTSAALAQALQLCRMRMTRASHDDRGDEIHACPLPSQLSCTKACRAPTGVHYCSSISPAFTALLHPKALVSVQAHTLLHQGTIVHKPQSPLLLPAQLPCTEALSSVHTGVAHSPPAWPSTSTSTAGLCAQSTLAQA